MNKKGVRKGCANESPLPQWAVHPTGLGSPPREVMVTSVWVGSHTQQKKEIGVVWVPLTITL